MSKREGLFAPAFCALSVRVVRSVVVGEVAVGDWVCPALPCVPYEIEEMSLYVGLTVSEARVWATP